MKNNQGFSMIEMLIGSALAVVVALGVVSYLNSARRTEDGVRTMQEFQDLVQKVAMAMDDPEICRANLKDKTLVAGTSLDIPTLSINNFDNPSAPTEMQPTGNTLKLEPFKMTLKKYLGNNRHIVDLAIHATRTQDALGPIELVQNLSLYVATNDARQILYCYSFINQAPSNILETVCKLTSDGLLYYNAQTDQCELRYEKVYFTGNRSTATCPKSTTVGLYQEGNGSKSTCRSSIAPDPKRPESRTYIDSRIVQAVSPRNYICNPVDDYTVNCIYASDSNSAGAICSAACKIDKMPEYVKKGLAAKE